MGDGPGLLSDTDQGGLYSTGTHSYPIAFTKVALSVAAHYQYQPSTHAPYVQNVTTTGFFCSGMGGSPQVNIIAAGV